MTSRATQSSRVSCSRCPRMRRPRFAHPLLRCAGACALSSLSCRLPAPRTLRRTTTPAPRSLCGACRCPSFPVAARAHAAGDCMHVACWQTCLRARWWRVTLVPSPLMSAGLQPPSHQAALRPAGVMPLHALLLAGRVIESFAVRSTVQSPLHAIAARRLSPLNQSSCACRCCHGAYKDLPYLRV
jgi:hypothetical protein